MPKVSVIVTTYNRKEYLAETIQSILNQTFQDFELIVVDNYSNYDFFGLMKSFNSEKITAFQNQNNGIIAVNRNFGIKLAKGEFIAFCDDDDIWISDKLKLQIEELQKKSADLIYSNTLLFTEKGSFRNSNYRPTNSHNYLLFTNHITLSSVIVRNEPKVEFNVNDNLVGIEDYELWLRLMRGGLKFCFITTPLVKYRIIDSSYSRLSRSTYELKKIQLKKSLLNSDSSLTTTKIFYLFTSLLISITRYSLFKILNR